MSKSPIIKIYFEYGKGKLWAVKDFPHAMIKELECFTPEELRRIADWIANTDYTKLEKPIHIEELT